MFARFLAWLQKAPIFFRVFFTFVISIMIGAAIFTPFGHDGVGAAVGLVGWVAFLVWKRRVVFGPKLPS